MFYNFLIIKLYIFIFLEFFNCCNFIFYNFKFYNFVFLILQLDVLYFYNFYNFLKF